MKLDKVRLPYGSTAEISLDLAPGSLVVLTGGSGVGKTTLLNIMLGLVKPAAGTVDVGATSFVPQNPRAWLNPSTTVAKVLAQAQYAASIRRRQDLDELLIRCRLDPGVAYQRCAHLSGGQSARVALARALATGADVLLADEPTAALDVANAASITRALVAEADRGATVIWATHDVDLARAVTADRSVHWLHLEEDRITLQTRQGHSSPA